MWERHSYGTGREMQNAMKIKTIDFVLLKVSDLKRASQFYQGILGLKQIEYREDWDWAEFNIGGRTLTLFSGYPEGRDDRVSPAVALAVDNVHAAFAELKEKEVKVFGEVEETTTCWMAWFADPDGNVLMLHKRKDETFG